MSGHPFKLVITNRVSTDSDALKDCRGGFCAESVFPLLNCQYQPTLSVVAMLARYCVGTSSQITEAPVIVGGAIGFTITESVAVASQPEIDFTWKVNLYLPGA